MAAFAQHADPNEQALLMLTAEETRRAELALKESTAELVLARVLARAREVYNALDRKLMDIFKKLVRAAWPSGVLAACSLSRPPPRPPAEDPRSGRPHQRRGPPPGRARESRRARLRS